jgi:predicted RNase H-like nuclease (RuvC/YqgF family)
VEDQRYDLENRLNSLVEKASARSPSPAKERTHTSNPSAAEIDNETLTEQVQHLQRKISMMEDIIEDSRANAEKEESNLLERMKRLKEKEENMKKEVTEGKKDVERMARAEEQARARVEEIEEALRESRYALEEARLETEGLRTELAVSACDG